MSGVMRRFLKFFMALSAAGLLASIEVHVRALLGLGNPFGGTVWGLHAGIFFVWFPAVFAMNKMTIETKRRDLWKVALRGCPPWMRAMVGGFFAYAIGNFLWFLATAKGAEAEANTLRGFSGHWMAFYSAALAILYSAGQVAEPPPEGGA